MTALRSGRTYAKIAFWPNGSVSAKQKESHTFGLVAGLATMHSIEWDSLFGRGHFG
jgi:hypothetical protein